MEMKHAQFVNCVKAMTNESNRGLMEAAVKGYILTEGDEWFSHSPSTVTNTALHADINSMRAALDDIYSIVSRYGWLPLFDRLTNDDYFRKACAQGRRVKALNETAELNAIMSRQMKFTAFLESLNTGDNANIVSGLMKAYMSTEDAYSINMVPFFESYLSTEDVVTDDERADMEACKSRLKQDIMTVAEFVRTHGTRLWDDFINGERWMRLRQELQNPDDDWHI